MDADTKKLTESLENNLNLLLNKINNEINKIPEEKRNETMANSETISDIKKAVQDKDMEKLTEIMKQCQQVS